MEGWININWEPKKEGPYLVKATMPSPKIEGKVITRYFIKRWNIYKCKAGHYQGYFSRGDTRSVEFIAWMPIPGHNYNK